VREVDERRVGNVDSVPPRQNREQREAAGAVRESGIDGAFQADDRSGKRRRRSGFGYDSREWLQRTLIAKTIRPGRGQHHAARLAHLHDAWLIRDRDRPKFRSASYTPARRLCRRPLLREDRKTHLPFVDEDDAVRHCAEVENALRGVARHDHVRPGVAKLQRAKGGDAGLEPERSAHIHERVASARRLERETDGSRMIAVRCPHAEAVRCGEALVEQHVGVGGLESLDITLHLQVAVFCEQSRCIWRNERTSCAASHGSRGLPDYSSGFEVRHAVIAHEHRTRRLCLTRDDGRQQTRARLFRQRESAGSITIRRAQSVITDGDGRQQRGHLRHPYIYRLTPFAPSGQRNVSRLKPDAHDAESRRNRRQYHRVPPRYIRDRASERLPQRIEHGDDGSSEWSRRPRVANDAGHAHRLRSRRRMSKRAQSAQCNDAKREPPECHRTDFIRYRSTLSSERRTTPPSEVSIIVCGMAAGAQRPLAMDSPREWNFNRGQWSMRWPHVVRNAARGAERQRRVAEAVAPAHIGRHRGGCSCAHFAG